MTERLWYTCAKCPPHGMADHSIYGDKSCCVDQCPCKGYQPDPEKPVRPRPKGKHNPVAFVPKS